MMDVRVGVCGRTEWIWVCVRGIQWVVAPCMGGCWLLCVFVTTSNNTNINTSIVVFYAHLVEVKHK